MMKDAQISFLARANAWLRTDTQEIDPAKVSVLRKIDAGSREDAAAFAKKVGVDPNEAVESARAMLQYYFAASIAASEKAAKGFEDYLPNRVGEAPADHGARKNAQLTLYQAGPKPSGGGKRGGMRAYYAREEERRLVAGVFPLENMELLNGAFRVHRASVEKEPVVRAGADKDAPPQLALKDPSGRILLLEARGPDQVVLSLGKRADFAKGTDVAKDTFGVSGTYAAELLPWVKGAVDRSTPTPGAERVLEALAKAVSARSEPSFSPLAQQPLGRAKFEAFLTASKPKHAPKEELYNAFAAAWNTNPLRDIPALPERDEWKELGRKDSVLGKLEDLHWDAYNVQGKLQDAPGDAAIQAELNELKMRITFGLWIAARDPASGNSEATNQELFKAFSAGGMSRFDRGPTT